MGMESPVLFVRRRRPAWGHLYAAIATPYRRLRPLHMEAEELNIRMLSAPAADIDS
jgi:hypothetical protein